MKIDTDVLNSWDIADQLIEQYRNSNAVIPEFDWVDEEECYLHAVAPNGYNLQFVKEQTYDLILNALDRHPLALKYVINQTDEWCDMAVGKDGLALKHVKNQTRELCMTAIKNNPHALQYVKEQDTEMVEYALAMDPSVIGFVKHKTAKMCMDAVDRDPEAFLRIYNPSPELCLYAVKKNHNLFGNVDFNKIQDGVIKDNLKALLTQALLVIPKEWVNHHGGIWCFYGLGYIAGYDVYQDHDI